MNESSNNFLSKTGAASCVDKDVEYNIAITGFGLFRDHQLNPSWEAIRDGKLIINRSNINVITKQVNVSYEEVDKVIPALWKDYDPILMVHIGLSARETALRIEQIARHGPYINDDVCKTAPHKDLRHYESGVESLEEKTVKHNYTCKPCSFDQSNTCIDVDRVCDRMSQVHKEGKVAIPTKKSIDAGLYVCEYIYQKSLQICDRCVFIHVPDVVEFSLEDIRIALQYAIEFTIDEVLKTGKELVDR